MSHKEVIRSRVTNREYREGWDNIFCKNKKVHHAFKNEKGKPLTFKKLREIGKKLLSDNEWLK